MTFLGGKGVFCANNGSRGTVVCLGFNGNRCDQELRQRVQSPTSRSVCVSNCLSHRQGLNTPHWNILSSHLRKEWMHSGISSFQLWRSTTSPSRVFYCLPVLDTEQITGHISGHMLRFYSPKTQQECKSQQERDEREGVAHGVHQLQGGQQGIVLHLDMGRADMTTRMQSVTPPSPQLHAQSHPGARHELRPSLSRKPAVRPFLLNSVGT